MAVETRYVVVRTDRNNKEQEVMTFTDKRAADEHDKMLDMADNMYDLLEASEMELSEQQCESLSIYLAKQREEVLFALQAKKRPTAKKAKTADAQPDMLEDDSAKKPIKPLSETLMEESQDESGLATSEVEKAEDNLVDFVIEKDDAA